MADHDTLVAFLTARLDEDEAVAREVIAEFARIEWAPGQEPGGGDDYSFWACVDGQSLHVAVGAERVLREVEAKRRIVERCRQWTMAEHSSSEGGVVSLQTLRQLAAVYADHPDYREEWRP